jgi:hypothetical protein
MGKFNIGVKNDILGHIAPFTSYVALSLELIAHETIKYPPVRQVLTRLLVCTRGGDQLRSIY